MSEPARRFQDGEEGTLLGGFDYRIVRGRKGPDDLVLQLKGPSEYRHVPMELGFMVTDFFVENENMLYREEFRYEGGRYYLRKLRETLDKGWRPVSDELQAQRRRRQQRDGRFGE